MPYDDIETQTNGISQLSAMDEGGGPGGPSGPGGPGGPDMGGQPMGGPGQPMGGQQTQGPGGPGIDTPQEQQALKLMMQGAVLFRRPTEIEPSIRYLVDELLQKTYLGVTRHYGMEQEGKLALQQSKIRADRGRAVALTGPPRGQARPGGGPQPSARMS